MKTEALSVGQRRYDNELPEPDRKVVCRMCGHTYWESEMAEKNPNVCEGCDEFERSGDEPRAA